jgi:alcohol dehydrogenase
LVALGLMGAEQRSREYLYEALDYVAKGKVRVMTETFPLDDIADADERVDNGNVRFRAVVTMS